MIITEPWDLEEMVFFLIQKYSENRLGIVAEVAAAGG